MSARTSRADDSIGPPLAPSRDGTALGGQSRPTDQTGEV